MRRSDSRRYLIQRIGVKAAFPQRSPSRAQTLPELVQLPVLGPDPANGPTGRAHDNRFGFDHFSAELHAAQHGTVGDAGRSEQAFAPHHGLTLIFAAWTFDAHFGGARALRFGIEPEPRLHLAADAAQRSGRQHALRGATDADIDIDAGLVRIGGVDDAGDV